MRTRVTGYRNLPPRDNRFELIEGTPAEQTAKLVDRLLEEKVL
jgi:hypothetical protein